MRTSPLLHGEFEQLLLACSEGCGLHLRMRIVLNCIRLYNSMLLGHTNLNICFSDPAGSHFAEFQKKKKKRVWSSVGNNKRCISTSRMRISILSYAIDEN